MKTIKIYKAQGFSKEAEVQSVQIVIDEEISDDQSLDEMRKGYELQGKRLCDALENSLPGGTLDQLFAELARRKASLFKVTY